MGDTELCASGEAGGQVLQNGQERLRSRGCSVAMVFAPLKESPIYRSLKGLYLIKQPLETYKKPSLSIHAPRTTNAPQLNEPHCRAYGVA